MKGDFIRINIMLFKDRSNQTEKYSMQNKAKIMNFSFFSKSALEKIFYLMVVGSFTHDLCKNAKNRIVSNLMKVETTLPLQKETVTVVR